MSPEHKDLDEVIRQVREFLTGLRFGSVAITVHDGRVVQIERTEKFRTECPSRASLPFKGRD